jgi:hypothetical protein
MVEHLQNKMRIPNSTSKNMSKNIRVCVVTDQRSSEAWRLAKRSGHLLREMKTRLRGAMLSGWDPYMGIFYGTISYK